jgi:salicylate hydroxylase
VNTLNVAVVGAGIGGLAAAAALGRKRIEVTVYEQARELGAVGAGVGLSYNSIRLLNRLKLGHRIREASSPMSEVRVHDRTGKLISTVIPEEEDRILGIYRPDLVAALNEGLSNVAVVTGHRCVSFDQDDDHATITFDNGERAVADVVVAADGVHSVLQGHVVPPSAPVFSGTIAYRGVLPANRLPDYPQDVLTGWMGDGRHFIVYPRFHGGELINWLGIVPRDEEMRESWSLPGDPAALAAEFSGWDRQLQHIISQIDCTFRWGLYDRDPLPRWTNGRLTLLGDAAHPMLPHAGQGANQAIEDGVALATLLDGLGSAEAPQALRRYEELRLPRTTQIQSMARVNGQLYKSADIADRGTEVTDVLNDLRGYYDYDVEAEAAARR